MNILTFEKIKLRYPNVLDTWLDNKPAKARRYVLIACPTQGPGCTARKPRWVLCYTLAVTGGGCRNCGRFKGGWIKNGYRMMCIRGERIFEHRRVMEKILGRKLRKGETVHHGVGGRADNRPENLSLRAPAKHPRGWSIREMRDYLRTIPKRLGGLK